MLGTDYYTQLSIEPVDVLWIIEKKGGVKDVRQESGGVPTFTSGKGEGIDSKCRAEAFFQ
ncbi:MAG: hypothetical protein D3906_13625 [Candidatus Electrothrix sp. AUS1_2]|nr:hypothetical protein [Candidatus Electrothrix sp. AUS1_2]